MGMPQLRVYDLRHTAATLWYDDGIPRAVISRWLGHAPVAVTDRVYVHLRPNDDYGIGASSIGQPGTQSPNTASFRYVANEPDPPSGSPRVAGVA